MGSAVTAAAKRLTSFSLGKGDSKQLVGTLKWIVSVLPTIPDDPVGVERITHGAQAVCD